MLEIDDKITEKFECIDRQYIGSRQRDAVCHFTWDTNYCPDIIEIDP